MKRILTILVLLAAYGMSMAATAEVAFRVNMGVAAKKGTFKVGTDKLYLAGSMNGWSNSNTEMKRTASTQDTVYEVVVKDMVVDSTYAFKFVMNTSSWENDPNRTYKVKASGNVFTDYWNRDNKYPTANPKPIKISFKCNMEIEIAKGTFDPAKDVLNVRGGWNGWSGNYNKMKKGLIGTVYTCDTTLNMIPGDSMTYKFAYTHAGNTTWETNDVRFGLSQKDYDNSTAQVIDRYFDFSDKKVLSKQGYTVYFTVNCKDAKPAISSGAAVFPNGVKSVVVCGSQTPLVWPAGGWPDASLNDLIKCNDNGTDGDLVAGDKIWTGKGVFPIYSGLRFEYKYGINYGMATDNAGSNDNEAYVGGNHIMDFTDVYATILRTEDVFGTMGLSKYKIEKTTDVENEGVTVTKFNLEQNYPNPFNPTTTIKYSVPEAGMVTLKVFNMLGQEVATLVNEVKSASENEVTFNAANLSSGLYVYQLRTANFTSTKKMMLLK